MYIISFSDSLNNPHEYEILIECGNVLEKNRSMDGDANFFRCNDACGGTLLPYRISENGA
jgi:hypothetical protein